MEYVTISSYTFVESKFVRLGKKPIAKIEAHIDESKDRDKFTGVITVYHINPKGKILDSTIYYMKDFDSKDKAKKALLEELSLLRIE